MEIVNIAILIIIIILLLIDFILNLTTYFRDAHYFKLEIKRSDSSRELRHWKKHLAARRISLIPLVTPHHARKIAGVFYPKSK